VIWNASPILFSIGSFQLHWYGVLFGTGFLVGSNIFRNQFVKKGLDPQHIDPLVVYMIIGTVVGARLGHTLIYQPEIYLHDPIRILKVWEGGLASHGGALGVVLSTWLWARKYWKGSFIQLLDFLAVPTPLVCAFIRMGNLFNSEILGKPSDVPWAVTFQRVDSIPRHPAMLYECFAYLFTYWVMRKMFKRGLTEKAGTILGTFLIMLFSFRFFIEFFKELQVPSEATLPMDLGQLLSIPFVLVGVFLVVRASKMASTPLPESAMMKEENPAKKKKKKR